MCERLGDALEIKKQWLAGGIPIGTEGGAHAGLPNAPAEQRRRDHRADRIQAGDVAADEAVAPRHREVHGRLGEDVSRAAAGAEQHAISERQLRQSTRSGGEPMPSVLTAAVGSTRSGADAVR